MPFCANCGADVTGSNFCPQCGKEVGALANPYAIGAQTSVYDANYGDSATTIPSFGEAYARYWKLLHYGRASRTEWWFVQIWNFFLSLLVMFLTVGVMALGDGSNDATAIIGVVILGLWFALNIVPSVRLNI